MNLGRQQIVTLGNAKRRVMLPKDRVDLLGEPRFVTELERDRRRIGCSKRRKCKEAAESLGIGLEVRRKLEEKEPKLARLPHGLERRDKLSHIVCALLQPLEMRNALWSLEAEPEVRRSRGQPAFEHLRRR